MNRTGVKYIVGEDAEGHETITIYNPEALVDKKSADGVTSVHHPEKAQEVKRLENPNNF